jgi:hypothetical protein
MQNLKGRRNARPSFMCLEPTISQARFHASGSMAQALGVAPHQETGVAPGQPSQRAFILGLLPFAF